MLRRALDRLKREAAAVAARVFDPATLPDGAEAFLRPDNPALRDLEARYAAMDPAVTMASVWTGARLPDQDMLYFRGDNHFIWQVRGPNRNALTYALVYYHLKAQGDDGLIDRLGEDGSFGASLFTIDGRTISRDLLDSVREIQFLRRHTLIGGGRGNVLDIGAGYGRLAWRLEQASGEDVRIFATDAFARSTFIADYHLRHRGAARASAVPLDAVEALLEATPIDIAVNVHSFSECRLEAIAWWVERLARHKVRHLMIVPNAGRSGGARCQLSDGTDFEPLLERFGYRIAVREPRYDDPIVQAYGIDPVHLHLFELR